MIKDQEIADVEHMALSPKRIEALHDGVFAIVMTLLVLEMKIPEVHGHEALHQAIFGLLPIVITYVVTFINLGIYWVGMQILFHFIERSDRAFSWLNILFLMLVSLLPFSSALLGTYSDDQWSFIIYGINLIGIGLSMYASWHYASMHHRLTVHSITPKFIREVKVRIVIAPIFALLAIGLSFVAMKLSLICYLILLPYYIYPGRIDHFWKQAAVPHQH